MTIDSDKILHDLLNSLDSLEGIRPGEIPNIALYMDQVTTFMDAQLASSRRFESDKVLTKTMINNYAKNKLLPPPVKKKYSPEHMMLLVFIYYFKNILSITDIQTLLAPITDRYFGTESGFSIQDIYDEIFQMEKEEIASVKEDLLKKADVSKSMFGSSPEEDREFLQLFWTHAQLLSSFFHSEVPGSMDEYTNHIWIILQNIIGASANDHTGFLFCQFPDDLCLVIKQIFIRCKILTLRRNQFSIVDSGLSKQRALCTGIFIHLPKRVS